LEFRICICVFHLSEFDQIRCNYSLSDHMTKRKVLDELTDDITSMSNDFDGADKRAAALRMSKAKKVSQCYETIIFTDLAAWPSDVTYNTVSDRLKGHIRDYYIRGQLHEERNSHDKKHYSHQFDALSIEEEDALAVRLCNIHAAIEYTARAQVVPEYLDYYTTGWALSKHWITIPRDGSVSLVRQRTMKQIDTIPTSALVSDATDYYDWSVDCSDKAVQHFLDVFLCHVHTCICCCYHYCCLLLMQSCTVHAFCVLTAVLYVHVPMKHHQGMPYK
jgi:hypothetical protein